MAFGKRETGQAGLPPTPTAPRRWSGGWPGYPLAILTVAVVSWLSMVAMALVPAFNPSGTPVRTIAEVAVIAALNITVVSTVMMGFVDLVLSLARYRSRWLYAAGVACLAYAFCLWAGSLGGGVPSLILYFGMALIPAAIGGAVLGHYRRDRAHR